MMISHFINQILFSFLEQRSPFLKSLIPSLPHLAAAYTFIPRGTDAAASEREGTRGTTSARMGT